MKAIFKNNIYLKVLLLAILLFVQDFSQVRANTYTLDTGFIIRRSTYFVGFETNVDVVKNTYSPNGVMDMTINTVARNTWFVPFSPFVELTATVNGVTKQIINENCYWDEGVPCGATKDVSFNLPSAVGSYVARLTCKYPSPNGSVTYTSSLDVPYTISVSAIDDAQFVSYANLPTNVTAGQTFNVSITMKNIGDTTWLKSASYKLGSQNPADNLTWGFNRVILPNDVSPGGQVTFNQVFTAPSVAGTYNFQAQMLVEGVKWFGAQTTKQQITVAPVACMPVCPNPSTICSGSSLGNDGCGNACAGSGTKTDGVCCVADNSCAVNTCSTAKCTNTCGSQIDGIKNCGLVPNGWREVAP